MAILLKYEAIKGPNIFNTRSELTGAKGEEEMKHDAKVDVTCDGENCDQFIQIDLDYVYQDYSGNNGHYCDKGVDAKIEAEGWSVDDDLHYCEDCCSVTT